MAAGVLWLWALLLCPRAFGLKAPTLSGGARAGLLPRLHGGTQSATSLSAGFPGASLVSTLPRVGAERVVEDPLTHLATDVFKMVQAFLYKSDHPTVVAVMGAWHILPKFWKRLLTGMAFGDFFLFLFFQLTYRRASRMAHKLQIFAWKWLALGKPFEFKKSILGFAEERGGLLAKIMGCNYLVKIVFRVLQKLGFRVDTGLPYLISKIAYTMYVINFVDLFKSQFLHTFFPSLAENRRQSYVVNRSTSVIIWIVGVLAASEMVSTYFKVPLSSTLAFGGVGGIALGLSARDIAANFLGGMLLLFNEPFTPGDMVTFRSGSTDLVGRVERVGWGQTRIRGRDTRPTYVPNSHFVSTAVTNMERITHRKFEATIPIRFQDHVVMSDILAKIKESLRLLPKLDMLSMPFRVSFVKFGAYALEIEITCYFATKSIDEFLALQQMANLEIVRVIRECGAQLALPTTLMHTVPASIESLAAAAQVPALAPSVAAAKVAAATPSTTTAASVTTTTTTTTASMSVTPALIPPPLMPPKTSESSKKKDLPPLATVAQSTVAAAATTSIAIPPKSEKVTITEVSSPPSSSSTRASLSPAAAAILQQAQTGPYIAETLGSTAPTAAAPRVVVGPATTAVGPPTPLPTPQPDPRLKSSQKMGDVDVLFTPKPIPAALPQQPLPPTASTPPLSAPTMSAREQQQRLFQQQFQQQQQQAALQRQQQLSSQAQALRKQRPVYGRDGSISWSWVEIEAQVVAEAGEESPTDWRTDSF